jgi:hypothetical protein
MFVGRVALVLVVVAVGLRVALMVPAVTTFLLDEERLLHEAVLFAHVTNAGPAKPSATGASDSGATPAGAGKRFRASQASLPWSSVAQLETAHGAGSNLNGSAVRRLYKSTLLDGALHEWVEKESAAAARASASVRDHAATGDAAVRDSERDAHLAFVAAACTRMRWHAKLYARRRHELHPFSSEALAWRDAWVHGVARGSWRNFVACVAGREEYPCPGLLQRYVQGTASDASAPWFARTLTSCRRSNDWWDGELAGGRNGAGSRASAPPEDL